MAIFFGFIAAYMAVLILSNLFQDYPLIWIIGAAVIFVATIIVYVLNLTSVFTVGAIVLIGGVLLLLLIRWIADIFR